MKEKGLDGYAFKSFEVLFVFRSMEGVLIVLVFALIRIWMIWSW